MLISLDLEIPFPRPLVYVTYRDQLEEQVAYMDSVDRVEVTSRRQEKGQVYCVNEWHSKKLCFQWLQPSVSSVRWLLT